MNTEYLASALADPKLTEITATITHLHHNYIDNVNFPK